ncbi:MAG: hydrogenase formation protein HypD, partial [Desulfocucumaceae bacterium]
MNILQGFRDKEIAGGLLAKVRSRAQKVSAKLGRPVLFMEVCGTHTVAISRLGLRQSLGGSLELRSGPGCPVCVTDSQDIDNMLHLAGIQGVTILTFGDMIRVPGSNSSTLEKTRAQGASVKTIYSPSQGIEMAEADPSGKYVMLGVGFETTAPIVAISIKEAEGRGLKNYFVYSTHKVIPPGLRALLPDPDLKIDGLILPGHVAAVTGRRALEFVSVEYGVPAVVAGFEPVDILGAINILLDQVESGEAHTVNGYTRVV